MNFNKICKITGATIIFVMSSIAYAVGPVTTEFHHTVEEARISVKLINGSDKSSGKVTATLLKCDGCIPETYTFNSTTVLINQFGATPPITDMQSWSGNRAMFHYRKADKHIEQLQILP